MEIKKSPKADLEGKKGVFFEIGLTLALAVLLFAFEWKSSTEQVTPFQTPAEEQIEDEIIPITQQMLKPPPPPPPAPKLTDLIDIVEDDTNIDDDLEILDAEDQSENQVIEHVADFGEYGEENTGESEIFQVVEDMPSFPGGNVSKWIAKNVKYPVLAMENGIQGKVFIQFVIERDGSITDVKVVRGVDASLDKEAVRVVQSMPKWKPGMQKGKAVAVKYTVPVVFRLEGGKTVNSQVTVNSKVSEFSVQGMNNPLYIVDGKEVTSSILSALDVNKIESMTVLKNESATEVYGEKGKNGVILITLKGSAEKSITLSNKSSVVNVPGLKGVYLNNRRAEWEDVDIFVDGEKIEMAGRALDEVVPPNRIESISVEKERNEAGRGKIYITTKAKEGVEKTSVRGDMKVEGFVQDKDGEPIVGATVLIEGTNMGTVTDVDGRFVMSASKEDKLVVSYIGMKGTKVKVASKVTITLKDE